MFIIHSFKEHLLSACSYIIYMAGTSVNKTKIPILMELHTSGMMFSLFGRPQSDESHEEDEEVAGTNNEELALKFI